MHVIKWRKKTRGELALHIGQIIGIMPLWLVFAAALGLNLISIRLGMLFAHNRRTRANMEGDSTIDAMVGATVGLLAFIVAFAFGATTDRFAERTNLLLQEVNAIETSYLRAGLVPEPHRSEVRKMLMEYVSLRVMPFESVEKTIVLIRKSEELQNKMWSHAEALAAANLQNADIVSLFVDALNRMFELQTDRVSNAMERHIQPAIWIMLISLFTVSSVALGYLIGMAPSTKKHWLPVWTLAMGFSCVILLIANYDREIGNPNLIHVNQRPMIELQLRLERRAK